MQKTITILVKGKVQGVFFRQSTREKALSLGITGRVRNQPDETVLIIASGTTAQLSELAQWCCEGPPKARVTAVDVNEIPTQQFDSFTIER